MRQPRPATAEPRLSADAQEALFAYGLVLPVVLLLVGLVAYPFFYAIYVSFTNRVVGNDGEWIGLANFRYLAGSAAFTSAIRNTIVLVVASDVLKLAIGLGLALLVNERIPARGLFRSSPDAALGDAGLRRVPDLARALPTDRRRHQPGADQDRPLSRDRRLARPALDGDAGGHRGIRLARLSVLVHQHPGGPADDPD